MYKTPGNRTFSLIKRPTQPPKSEQNRSDFGHRPITELFGNGTKPKNAEIRTFRFRTFTS